MFLQKVSLAFIAGWLLNHSLCERHHRYSYVLPPPTRTSDEVPTYEPYQGGYSVENSIEPFPERQPSEVEEEEVPPSPYSPPPMDDSANEDLEESETEASTTELTTAEPTTPRESIRKKRKHLKRKLSALSGAEFRNKFQRRSSAKLRKAVGYGSAESYVAQPPPVYLDIPTLSKPPTPARAASVHFVPQNQAPVPRIPPPVRGPLSLPSVGAHSPSVLMSDPLHAPPPSVASQVMRAPPLMLTQVHPPPLPPPSSAPQLPHSVIISQFHPPNRSLAPELAAHSSASLNSYPSHAFSPSLGSSHPIPNTVDYPQSQYQATSQILSSPFYHPSYSALHPLTFPWPQPVPVINLTPQAVTTTSPKKRSTNRPSIKPTERIRSYFRKRSSYPRSNDGVIKGHVHDHISFKKTFHMTLFKIPFLSIDVAKKVYKDESLIADLGKRTGESYNRAHG